jgi:hypothetical protein
MGILSADLSFVHRITANSNECLPLSGGFNPTFILLDFVDQGQAFDAADVLNGFPPTSGHGTEPTTYRM